MYIPTLRIPTERPGVATTPFGPHLLTCFFVTRMCMGESSDALVRPIIFLGVHVRLAGGGQQAVLCGASAHCCKTLLDKCKP